jgi:hypothetical protein
MAAHSDAETAIMAGGLDLVIRYVARLTGTPSARQTADGALVARFIHCHDDVAFAELVHRHGPTVWTVCRQILAEPHDAEDAFQATFLVLVKKARSIRRRDSLASWLHGVAYRIAIRAPFFGKAGRSHGYAVRSFRGRLAAPRSDPAR